MPRSKLLAYGIVLLAAQIVRQQAWGATRTGVIRLLPQLAPCIARAIRFMVGRAQPRFPTPTCALRRRVPTYFSAMGAALPVISRPQRVTRLCRCDFASLLPRKSVLFWPRPGGARSDVSRNDVDGERWKRGPCAKVVRDCAIRHRDAGKLGSP